MKDNIRVWINRYLPATIAALVLSTLVFILILPFNKLLAAYCASISDTLIYYVIILGKDFKNELIKNDSSLLIKILIFIRSILIEFGPAEILDTYFIRPALLYYASKLFTPNLLTIIVTIIFADIIFHFMAIIGFEINKKIKK